MLGNLEITKQDEGEFFLIILNVLALKKGPRGQAVSPGGRAHQQRWTHQSALKATCLPLLPLSLSWDPPPLKGKGQSCPVSVVGRVSAQAGEVPGTVLGGELVHHIGGQVSLLGPCFQGQRPQVPPSQSASIGASGRTPLLQLYQGETALSGDWCQFCRSTVLPSFQDTKTDKWEIPMQN